MARTLLTKTTAPGSNPASGTALTMNTGDHTNNNQFHFTGNELVIAVNTDASGHVFTIPSVVDDQGRTGDATDTIAAGVAKLYGPFKDKTGWQQSGNMMFCNPADDLILIGVIALPGY